MADKKDIGGNAMPHLMPLIGASNPRKFWYEVAPGWPLTIGQSNAPRVAWLMDQSGNGRNAKASD